MDERRTPQGVIALLTAVAIAVLALAGILLAVIVPEQGGRVSQILASVAAGGAIGPIGMLIVRRRGNAVGWVLLEVGAALAFAVFAVEYGIVATTGPISLPAPAWVMLAGQLCLLFTAGGVCLLFLLFPAGDVPGRRWRLVPRVGLGLWSGIAVLNVVNPSTMTLTESAAVTFANPAGIEGLRSVSSVLLPAAGLLALVLGLSCIVSLVVRFRTGSPDDRERIKWLAYVAVSAVVFLFLGEVASSAAGCENSCGNTVWNVFFAGLALGAPASIGVAILRHALYDIEVVIRKTVVVAAVAVVFVLVYALVVGGIGALVQTGSNTALSFAAAAVVAVLSQPVLARARRLADLIVYGRRATPYEVLAGFSGAMAATRASEVVLEEMARVAGEGAGAQQAGVWLRVGGTLREAATWPQPLAAGAELPLTGRGTGITLPELGAEVAVPVRHNEELLGALTLTMPASEPATPVTRKLITDLAGQAGLVLRNVQLIEELRASRRRLVTAQDEERRKLERNLHDGAQQQLIALRIRLRIAEATLRDDPGSVGPALAELGEAAQSALDDLRDLARGIYPPLLADRGLAAALEAQAKKSPIDVQVAADGLTRYPQDTEAAVYFCSLEALQNVAKYARATAATIRLSQHGAQLIFAVSDDGEGFDPAGTSYGTGLHGMADRLSALGGELSIESAPGSGTTVRGRLPVPDPNGPVRDRAGAAGAGAR